MVLPMLDSLYRDFNASTLPRKPVAFMLRFLDWRFRGRLVGLIAVAVGGVVALSLESVALRDLVEALRAPSFSGPGDPVVWGALARVVGIWIISAIFARLREFAELKTHPQVREEVQVCLFAWLIRHAPDFFHQNFSGRLAQRVKQAGDSALVFMVILFNDLVRGITSIVAAMVILGHHDPGLGLAIFAGSAFYMGITVLLARRCAAYSKRLAEARAALTGDLVDVAGNADVVRSFAKGREECHHIAQAAAAERNASLKLRWFLVSMWSVLAVVMVTMQGSLLAHVVRETLTGARVPGDTVMAITLMALIVTHVAGAAARVMDFLEHQGVMSNALDSILEPHAIVDVPLAPPLIVSSGAICFESVDFHHADGTPVFKGLDLVIQPGSRVGLVGTSGAGKSTLIKLLRRHYQPKGGRVLIDGQDIALVTQDSVNQAIAEVPQQPGLFHRSIEDNIRYAKTGASLSEVQDAARLAHCEEFILARPKGYQALVGEHGIQLSGGERQRIAIARALLKDAPILVLDEATSSLDSETEHVIREALWTLFESRTVIAIAHRLSTIASMDRILCLDGGRIVEDGTHEQLLGQGGLYARLWQRQADGFLVDA